MGHKKNKRFVSAIIATVIVAIVVIAGLIFFTQFKISVGDPENTQPEIVVEEVTYTQDEVDALLEQAKHDGETSLLATIKRALEEGETPLAVFKSLYPEYIVVASQGMYHFVDILDDITHHGYNPNNLVIDEENGICTYVENGVVTSKKGIDVSSHQGKIDWNKVADDGVEFAFVRAVYRGYESGKLVEDEFCKKNLKGASDADIDVGVYVFSQAITTEEAIEEADMVLDIISDYDIKLPVVYDIERVSNSKARMNQLSVQERTDITKAFLEYVSSKGYDVMIYHNTEMGALLIDLTQLDEYDKWFAGYTLEMYWPYNYRIWQYSESGKVDGIKSNVDLNIMMP
ncbi:MAG: hypothetical protein HUJ71_06995 [Pseudobutyrivibrio sp.]|nr:hypothetical protein [Pseudobutyrivibrio sp.]